eukprot:COSAG01_NODE_67293_length_267_cov_1.130952_1_plen_43_part_10
MGDEWEKEVRQKKMANPLIYTNPVFDEEKNWLEKCKKEDLAQL